MPLRSPNASIRYNGPAMLAAQTLAPAVPVFTLTDLPAAPVIASTTAFLLTANLHQGGRSTVATWQVGLLPRKALGMSVCWCDSTRRSRSPGKERDSETNLDYFGARYMSSAQGRFTSPDEPLEDQYPADPQSWNLYSYVRNNPLSFTDPTGRDCVYTNNFSSNGSVTVVEGNCIRANDGGHYVDGTVDMSSLRYDENGRALSFNYANDQNGTGGSGVVGNLAAPSTGGQLGDAAASTLHQAGLMADNGVKAGAAQMAMNAAGVVVGRLIGAAL